MRKNATQFLLPNSPPRTSKLVSLHRAALTGLISLALCTAAPAAGFSGSFKGVTITDSAGVNKPPTAVFTYRQDGQTLSFDASGSADADGSITRYKWDFGNGTTSEGATATYTLNDTANLRVTLTVIDNNNGVALSQQTITLATNGIADDFSTDTLGNYTTLSGGLKIFNGAAQASGAWTTTFAIHNKELASNDHGVEADVYSDGASATGGLMFRVNKLQNTGYVAAFSGGKFALYSYNAGAQKWLAQYDGKYAAAYLPSTSGNF